MKIKPTENWKLLGTSIKLSKDKTYNATRAVNQPDYIARGSIFVDVGNDSMMLDSGEYKRVD